MGAALNVGRVGGLAVALGIGAAAWTAQAATAHADTDSVTDSAGTAAQRSAGPARPAASPAGRAAIAPVTGGSRVPAAATAGRGQAREASPAARRPTARAAATTPARARRAAAVPLPPAAPAARSAGTPVAPAQTTGFGGLFEAFRREFFNASPTITPVIHGQSVGESGRAVITGNLGAADADGDSLHWTYLGDPQNGGHLEVDQTTGEFTYTAPDFMTALGGYDQFNVVVSDQTPGAFPTFHGIVDLLSYIPVLGPQIVNNLQLFGLATPYTNSVPARIGISVAPVTGTAPLHGDAAELSATPIAGDDEWRRYVLTPQGCTEGSACTVRPVSLYYRNGGVSVADNGAITLTYSLGGQAPMVILDYGQNVSGFTRFSYYGATPNLVQASYSESLNNLSAIGDGAASSALLANSGDPLTFQIVPVLGNGTWQGSQLQGGFRYQRITLNLPGTITLTNINTELTPPLRGPDGYQGHFLSNSDTINRIWYAGAYTINLDEIAAGTPGFAGPYPLSILGEAAKRDRAIWAGDLLTAGWTLHDVFGADGDLLARNNLQIMADNPVEQFVLEFLSLPFRVPSDLGTPGPAPGVCSGVSRGGCEFWGASYSMALAQNMANYYRLTGDTEFVRRNWQALQRAVTYGNSLINPSTGLVDVPQIASLDWSVVGRAVGQVTSTNVIQYDSLTSAALLAAAIGDDAAAAQYSAQAAALKDAINTTLWNPELGAYDASTAKRGFVVQDANVWAVLYGVADAERSARIVQTLADTLSTPYGIRAAEAGVPGYPQIVSPFIGSFNLPADYLAGRPDLAMQQMLATWGHMIDTDAGSTTWERINLPGGDLSATQLRYLFGDSASHAWSTGATSALSDYVLGITAADIAYRSWQVKPHPQGLTWAQGQVPTAAGPIVSRWQLGEDNFRLTVEGPQGTPGSVAVPTLGSARVIYRDGVQVWDGTAAVNGATATATADGYVVFTGVSGSHTWAW